MKIVKQIIQYKYKNKMIIDGFIFYNEIKLLLYRLTILYDKVDYFVLVESRQTFAGNPKPLYFQDNISLFQSFLPKIIPIVIDMPYTSPTIDYTKGQQWVNEAFQRNSIDQGIKTLSLTDQDIIMISDVDEIPDMTSFVLYKIDKPYSCVQDMYYYDLHTKSGTKWFGHVGTKILPFFLYKQSTPHIIRNIKTFPLMEPGGWHLSYFGDSSFIKNKIQEFSHQELNTREFTDTEAITEKIKKGKDLFDRGELFQTISIHENNYLPPLYQIHLTDFIK